MKSIGIIDPTRMASIPARHHAAHEFCFHLHDTMAHTLVDCEMKGGSGVKFQIESDLDRELLESGINIIDFFEKTGRGKLERRVVLNRTSIALYSDILHFIYEGLIALEKRKFIVAFALFRKPFKEGMLLTARMCADEDEFFEKMKVDAKNLLNRNDLDKDGIIKLLNSAAINFKEMSYVNPESIYAAVFDRKNKNGLAPLFDKATHLITENNQIQTENYNVNFIFKDPNDDDVYDSIYPTLAMLLNFLSNMQIELYGRMNAANNKLTSLQLFQSIGVYETLFSKGQSRITNFVNRSFKDFLVCPLCSSKIKVKKNAVPRLFIGESLDCDSCGMSHHFPFSWLLSKLDLNFLKS